MSEVGFIKVWRGIRGNPIWLSKDPFDKRSALLDILMEVRWHEDPEEVLIGSKVFLCYRGQSLKSLETWAKRWRWGKSETRRFMNVLRKLHIIETQNERVTTRLTVCNYDTYQDARTAFESITDTEMKRKRNASETQVTPEEERKEGKEGKEGEEEKGSPRLFGESFKAFQQVHPECRRVNELQFVAAVRAEMPVGVTSAEMAGHVEKVLIDFELNCSVFSTFAPQGPISKFRNYLSQGFKIEKKSAAEKKGRSGLGSDPMVELAKKKAASKKNKERVS